MRPLAYPYAPPNPMPQRAAGLLVALAIHAAAIAMLTAFVPMAESITPATPIAVRLIAPAAPEPHKPEPILKRQAHPQALPVPRALTRPAPVAPPVIARMDEAPDHTLAPPAPPEPVVSPPIENAGPAAAAAAAASPPRLAPAPVLVPPSFNADYLSNPAPAYPALSRRLGEQGKVTLRVLVSEQGLPREIQLRTSSGHARLDEAALATVKQWKFVPARRGDSPVAAWVLVPISFSLRS